MKSQILLELIDAHQIIKNMLSLMTAEQKTQLSKINQSQGLIECGTTRANEREAAIHAGRVEVLNARLDQHQAQRELAAYQLQSVTQ